MENSQKQNILVCAGTSGRSSKNISCNSAWTEYSYARMRGNRTFSVSDSFLFDELSVCVFFVKVLLAQCFAILDKMAQGVEGYHFVLLERIIDIQSSNGA
eukprot:scaffold1157_cov122-Cylindrotheca_fusiformis.AAC.22